MKPLMVIPPSGRRRRRSAVPRVVAVVLGVPLAYLAFFALTALRYDYPVVGAKAEGGRSSVRGAFHVHSVLSDGRGTPEEIAREAKAAGLQFVVLTDHNRMTLAPPRFVEGVLLIEAVELSTPKGHVVALGLPRGLSESERQEDVFAQIERAGGVSVIAHPVQEKMPFNDWARAQPSAGLELYSADSMLREAQSRWLTRLLPAVGAWFTNELHALMYLVVTHPEATDRLLAAARDRSFVALCAHDAHGLPAYGSVFRALSTYLPDADALPADPAEAARLVMHALAQGRSYCAFDAIAPAEGFALAGIDPETRTAKVGGTLQVQIPDPAPPEVEVRVHGPATVLDDGRTVRLEGEGPVHVEVWARIPGFSFQDGWKPWIVPSPVRVVPDSGPPAEEPPEASGADAATSAAG